MAATAQLHQQAHQRCVVPVRPHVPHVTLSAPGLQHRNRGAEASASRSPPSPSSVSDAQARTEIAPPLLISPRWPMQSHATHPRLAAFSMALSACGLAIFELLSAHEADLPRLPLELVGPAAAALAEALAAALACVALAKATVLRDSLHFEWHRGQLHVQLGVPSSGPSMPQGAVQVLPTTDGRGNGAFAALPIPRGCHICDYEGQPLTPQQFFARYPDGVGDFTTDLGDCLIDASHLVGQTSTFSAVHMNSSRVRPNVVRFFDRGARRVAFFASRDIAVGEELLYDYGRRYWATREHLEKA